MVEAVMISDYRADVETSLSLAKVLIMLMLMLSESKIAGVKSQIFSQLQITKQVGEPGRYDS